VTRDNWNANPLSNHLRRGRFDLSSAATSCTGAKLTVVTLVAHATGKLGLLTDLTDGVVLSADQLMRLVDPFLNLPLDFLQLLLSSPAKGRTNETQSGCQTVVKSPHFGSFSSFASSCFCFCRTASMILLSSSLRCERSGIGGKSAPADIANSGGKRP